MKSYLAKYGPDMTAIGAELAGDCDDRMPDVRYRRLTTTIAVSAEAIKGSARRARWLGCGKSSIAFRSRF